MWKRVTVILAALAAGGYSAVWFRHADQTKTAVADALAASEAKHPGVKIRYDAIAVGGFPLTFVTRVTNPRLEMDYAAFSASADAGEKETAALTGEVVLTADYWHRRFSLEFNGVAEGRSEAADTPLRWSGKATQGDCSVTVTRDADISMFSAGVFANFKDPAALFKNVESIRCHGDPVEIVNKENGDILLRGGTQVFSLSGVREDQDKVIRVDGALHLADMEVGDQWYEWRNALTRAIHPGVADVGMLPVHGHQAVGKQNTEIKLSYRGPMRFRQTEDSDLELHVPVLSIRNDLYTFSSPFSLRLVTKGKQVTGDISLEGDGTYAAAMDDLVDRSADTAIEALYAGKMPGFEAAFGKITEKISAGDFKNRIRGVTPALGSFGTFTTALQASFKGSEDERFHRLSGEANVSKLTLKLGKYGFSATGSLMTAPRRGEATLRCHECRDTLEKLLVFTVNLQRLVSLFNPVIPMIPEDEGFKAAVIGFVNSLSQPAEDAAGDRLVHISDSGNGRIIVSGRPLEEVMMLAIQHFAPKALPLQPAVPQ